MSFGLNTSAIKSVLVIIFLVLMAACADMPRQWDPQAYTVKSGDTLYSIAWRYEKDFREIAEWNDIHPPYAIYPGQRLAMQPVSRDGTRTTEERPQLLIESSTGNVLEPKPEEVSRERLESDAQATHVVVKKNDTLYSIARGQGLSHHQLARWNHLRSPYTLRPGQKLRLSPPVTALGQQSTVPSPASSSVVTSPVTRPLSHERIQSRPVENPDDQQSLPTRVDRWRWPVKGRVVKTYRAGDTSRKGIAIAGKSGQSVNAAAAGTVVYSGNGLINYGNLVIIKHSHSFLSAYAHNKSLLVKEGDNVKSGQTIAKMGRYGGDKASLHFEIRRNGKPVNPLNYLPKS